MDLLAEFARVFELPPAMIPHIAFVAEPQEMSLVVTVGRTHRSESEIAGLLGRPLVEMQAFLERAYYRHIVDREQRDGVVYYWADTFYRRLDPLSMYENWGDVPAEAREAVSRWQLEEFIDKWRPAIDAIMQDSDAYVRIPNRDVLLLEEALAQVEAASEHVVVPCDCRAIVMACQRPVEACIRLDEGARHTLERGMGRRLTKAECLQLVIDLERAGLMHTGDRDGGDDHHFGFCNCCACDCYPIRASASLGLDRAWPRSHFVAERDDGKCEMCGKCAQRCHFHAFYLDGTKVPIVIKGKVRQLKHVAFDPAQCWGCGLCASTCPESAITMRPLAAPALATGALVASAEEARP